MTLPAPGDSLPLEAGIGISEPRGPHPETAAGAAGRTALTQQGIASREREPAPPGRLPFPRAEIPPVSSAIHRVTLGAAMCVDLAAVGAAFTLAALARFGPADLSEAMTRASGVASLTLGALLWLVILSARRTYAPRVMVSAAGQLLRALSAAVPAWVLTHFLAFLLKAQVPFESRLVMGLSFPLVVAFLAAERLLLVRPLARRVYRRLSRGSILVLGDTARAARLAAAVEGDAGAGRLVMLHPLATISPEEAGELVERCGVAEVLIEPDGRTLEETFDVAFACLDAHAEVRVVSNQFQVVMGRAAIGDIEGVPVMRFRRFDLAGPDTVVKRAVDLCGAAAALLVLAPVLLAIAIAVKFSSPGAILFRQERVGRWGKRFWMYKFRTMVAGNDPRIHQEYLRSFIRDGAPAAVTEDGTKLYKLTEDPRVTRVGAWLRGLSLDELPQLWNVLRGEMSLVGPRPCLPYEWEMYRPWQKRRLDVPPGCTGLWQVTARSHVGFEEMVILDLHYAHHGTIGRDLWLIAQTIPAMIRSRGGY